MMNTNMMCWCTTDKGKHGLQRVQSVLVGDDLYYLECGCIYRISENVFKRLRTHVRKCSECGKDIEENEKVLMDDEDEVWCMNCSMGKKGIMKKYYYDIFPRFETRYEVDWQLMNDKEKLKRDNKNKEDEK